MRRKYQRSCIALAVASAFAGTSTLASAAGFALIEQSASGMGNAFAGAAATAEDASTTRAKTLHLDIAGRDMMTPSFEWCRPADRGERPRAARVEL